MSYISGYPWLATMMAAYEMSKTFNLETGCFEYPDPVAWYFANEINFLYPTVMKDYTPKDEQ